MPFLAIFETDFRTMLHSWIFRIWAILLAGQSLMLMAVSSDEATLATEAISGMLGLFPLVWSTVVIVFSSGAISSESGVVADSILSKSVRRSEYILAKLLSRGVIVVALFVFSAGPVTYVVAQNATGPVDSGGVVWAFVLIGLMLALLTSLAIASSTLFNRTLVAVVVIWFVWYAAGAVMGILNAEYLSPLAIIDSLPRLLKGDYETGDLVQSVVGYVVLIAISIGVSLLHFTRKDV